MAQRARISEAQAIKNRKQLLWFPIGLSVLLVLWALSSLWNTFRFVKSAESVTGIVISNELKGVGGGYDHRGVSKPSGTLFYSIVEYPLPSGEKTTYTIMTSSKPRYPKGAEVQLLYPPDNPFLCRDGNWVELWGYPLAGLLGALLLLALSFHYKNRDWKAHQEKQKGKRLFDRF